MRPRLPLAILGLFLIGAGLVAFATVHVVNSAPLFWMIGIGVVITLVGIALGRH